MVFQAAEAELTNINTRMDQLSAKLAAVVTNVDALTARVAKLENGKPEPEPEPEPVSGDYIILSKERLMALPTTGDAWNNLKAWADKVVAEPDLSNQDDKDDMVVLAKALVYARTGETRYRDEAIQMLELAVGTENPGDTLGVVRNYAPLVLAADLVKYTEPSFVDWLIDLRDFVNPDRDYTVVTTQEKRPNNWGTWAGLCRVVIDLYAKDTVDLARAIIVLKGYLGDYEAYHDFVYGELSWQANPDRPVGINPKGAVKDGFNLDGIKPDDQRRAGSFPTVGDLGISYHYEANQGLVATAAILKRFGYTVTEWSDQAVKRTWDRWFDEYPPEGDDLWQTYAMNYLYETDYPVTANPAPGKGFGFTDWLYS